MRAVEALVRESPTGAYARRIWFLFEWLTNSRLAMDDARFVTPGFRTDGGFVGEHDRDTGEPLPEHISARADDLPDLIDGVSLCDAAIGVSMLRGLTARSRHRSRVCGRSACL